MDSRIVLTDEILLNMSIKDFEEYSRQMGKDKLFELFFQAQDNREKFANFMENHYLVDPLKEKHDN